MGDPYADLPPGASVTKISRTAQNALLAMLRQWRAGRLTGTNRTTRTVAEVLVRNDTYVTYPAFSIMGLGDPLISPFDAKFNCQQRPAFSGVEPTVADHLGKWVALEEPIAHGAIGRAVLVGFAVVRLYVNGADDRYCDVIDAKTLGGLTVYLGTGQSGARILWRENAGSGEGTICWAIVRVGDTISKELVWHNDDATACPAYGVAAVTGTHGTEPYKIIQGDQPSATVRKQYIVNAGNSCAAAATGICQPGEWVLAAYDSGTPALDEVWIPKNGQWTLTKGEAGVAWGVVVAGIVDATNKILLGKIVDGAGGAVKWAVWDSGSNDSGAATRSFQVKECKYDGTGSTGSAFTVKTPIKKNVHTSLFTGYVVGYQIEADGTKVIVTDCWDDPFGVVKQWDAAIANVPDGWAELTTAQGRYIVGVDGDHALDATGGAKTHDHDAHTLDAPDSVAGWGYCGPITLTHSTENHEPPWLGLYNIKRTS